MLPTCWEISSQPQPETDSLLAGRVARPTTTFDKKLFVGSVTVPTEETPVSLPSVRLLEVRLPRETSP
jgi:hypothetical protein